MARPHARKQGVRQEVWLPPEEVRLWEGSRDGLLDTPVDECGLVDLDELVQLGKELVVPGYDWSSPFNDVHHLQWPKSQYARDDIRHAFREQVQRKAYLPRRFHNWLHLVTLPPALPSEEAMRNSIAAEKTARALAATAERAVRLTRKKGVSEAQLARRLEEAFDTYTLYVENAREVPEEFQLVKLEEIEANTVDEMLAANRHLGKRALHLIPVRYRALQVAA